MCRSIITIIIIVEQEFYQSKSGIINNVRQWDIEEEEHDINIEVVS